MKVKKLPFEVYKSIYSKVPRLTVDLLVKNDQGVLLTKRNIPPDIGWWHFPGGTVLMGETFADAVSRVASEELSTKVEIVKMIGVLEYIQGSGLGYSKSVVFLVKPLKEEVSSGEQSSEIGYFSVPPAKTLPEVKKFLEEQPIDLSNQALYINQDY